MAIRTYRKGSVEKLSENFRVHEFACKGSSCLCTTVLVDDALVNILQKIRDHFGKVTITSAYRCSKHNKKVGGATKSYHTKGQAADIKVDGVSPAEVAKYAESIGVKGIGLYETAADGFFVHIDTRTYKSFWYGQKQAARTTFGGSKTTTTAKANDTVKAWQSAAKADGFTDVGSIDGIWGKKCETVAKKALCYCRSDGNFRNKNLTKIVQSTVGAKVDGKFGSDTEKAVIAWQKANGLNADGVVGYNSWLKILNV